MDVESPQEIADLLKDHVLHPAEAADLLKDASAEQVAEVVKVLDEQQTADLVEHLDLAIQRDLVNYIPRGHMAKVIERMAHDARVDLVKELPEEVADSLLPLIARAERMDIARLASYEEGTAGSVMTTEYAVVSVDATVEAAIRELRRQAPGEQTGSEIYVIDADRKLVGSVTLRDLLLTKPEQQIRNIMKTDIVTVNATDDQEKLGEIFSKYEISTVPVVDDAGRLVGRITAADVIDVVEEEADEDIYRLGAAGQPIDYLRASILKIARQRLTWLLILVGTGLITSSLLQHYQAELTTAIALAFFLPLLSGSGGNAGSQTTAVVIRGLSTGEIQLSDVWRVVLKELAVGLMVGTVLGVFAAARALLVPGGFQNLRLGLTVGLAMTGTVTLAKALGALLPIFFQKIHLDPALMSAPFISSIVDILTIITYFTLARLIYLR
ncbi:MAG TPA: magnesium transporter [Planctomycetota bacterium]|nr:magnesium transporter [Planctomycetota bacterium]